MNKTGAQLSEKQFKKIEQPNRMLSKYLNKYDYNVKLPHN